MAELLRIANAEYRPRQPDEFAETETCRDILRSLDPVRSLPDPAVTMIAGAPGIGKTRALEQFCAGLGYDAIYHRVASGEGKPTAVAASLLHGYYMSASGISLSKMRETLASYIGRGRVLVLDEAQYLDAQGAEWARALAEDGAFDLVLCGDLALERLVYQVPQLQSRMIRPVVIAKVSRADVAALVDGTAFANPVAIDLLHATACLKGGLRNVQNVTRLAQLFAGGDRPGPDHLKAAIADMKLMPKETAK